ncbi:hypothetical protein WMF11_42820 [Sorangium sp. So ce295]|uniref:hypothetical protein n=1 Tax=Sorangium sp. So ce295 TaxID=3133295 RepID=UPI003F5EAFBD
MGLKISTDEDEIFLFERVVKHLQSSYGYSLEDAERLVSGYYEKFTDQNYCDKYDIMAQTMDFFGHIESRGMADRVHFYEGLKHEPDEAAFIEWQQKMGCNLKCAGGLNGCYN